MDPSSFSYLASVEVFLLSPDRREVLLLERALTKKVLPGYWAGLGGKMDARRLESPRRAALREMTEESGYTLRTIRGFRPAGIYTVEDRFGRWLIFEYTAVARKKLFTDPVRTEEGTLAWIPIKDLTKKRLIPDLRRGLLVEMLKREKFLEVTVSYGVSGRLKKILSEKFSDPS